MGSRFASGNPFRSVTIALAPAAALVLVGCGASGGGGRPDALTADGSAETSTGLTVNVLYHGETRAADLSKPATTEVNGLTFVRLSDVVRQAYPTLDLAKVAADFLGGDGFKPGSKANCATLIPVPGTRLAKGYISPETRNLAWDESLQYPGCMRVHDTAEIDLVGP